MAMETELRSSRRIMLLTAAALSTTSALAQTTPGVTINPSPAPAQAAPAPVAAAPAAAPARAGGPTLRETKGDWEIHCDEANNCFMLQTHRNAEGAPDVIFKVIKPKSMADANGQAITAAAEIFVPLGVYLPDGLGLRIDQTQAQAAPYYNCVPLGCTVRAPLAPELIESLKQGTTATVIVALNPKSSHEVPISLKGFTAAFGGL